MSSYQIARLGQRRVRGTEQENRRSTEGADQQWVSNEGGYLANGQNTESRTDETPDGIAQ